jgi:hypothetical protein
MFFFPRGAGFRLDSQLDEKVPKKFIRVRRRRPRKFDRALPGLQLLREFSSSPRSKNVLAKETPELIKIRHSISITRCSERGFGPQMAYFEVS